MENMSVVKLLLKLSPPVMLALLIQSIYNIVDSFFISRYSAAGLYLILWKDIRPFWYRS